MAKQPVRIYVSWAKGLANNPEALAILRAHSRINGVEMSNVDGDFELIKAAGLGVSSHVPTRTRLLNLASSDIARTLGGDAAVRILQVIRDSREFVGLHLGYSAKSVMKMVSYPNIPRRDAIITGREELLQLIYGNVMLIDGAVNAGQSSFEQKSIILETMDYSRPLPVPWEMQSTEILAIRGELEEVIAEHGTNAGLLYVTDQSFVFDLLRCLEGMTIVPVGFLFDVAHNLVAADAKIHSRVFEGNVKEYFYTMLVAVRGTTRQIHLSKPSGDATNGYSDTSDPFGDDELSRKCMRLAQIVVNGSPDLEVVTLEINSHASNPVEHARIMCEQVDYVVRELGI